MSYLCCLNKISNLFERHDKSFERVIMLYARVTYLCKRHNKSFKRVIMLLKRVNNLCAEDKKRKENVPSGGSVFVSCFAILVQIAGWLLKV